MQHHIIPKREGAAPLDESPISTFFNLVDSGGNAERGPDVQAEPPVVRTRSGRVVKTRRDPDFLYRYIQRCFTLIQANVLDKQ